MTTITGRCIKLLKLLIEEERPITVKRLAKKIGISERTVRYDSVVLANWLEENGISLQRRPRVGYYLEDKEVALRLMDTKYYEGTDSDYYYTAQERVFKIIGLALSGEDSITIQDIMDHLYVSRSTVIRDLAKVRDWFSARGVDLRRKPNEGIRLQVSEQEWRDLVADWIRENVEEEDFSQHLLGMLVTNSFDSSKSHEMLKYLDKIITLAGFKTIRGGIAQVCDQLGIQLSDIAFLNLLIHVAIAMNRLLRGKQIIMDEDKLVELQQHKAYHVVDRVFCPLLAQNDIQLPQSEVGYITMHFLSAQKLWEQDNSDRDVQVDEMIEIVLRHVQRVYHINLRQNANLIRGLKLHLQPAIFRNKYDIPALNPLLDLIKSDYPVTYKLCCDAIEEINQRYNIVFDENEIGFIAVHIEAALKYYRGALCSNYNDVVLICASGLGSAKILSANIRSEFPNLRIVAELSVMDVAGYDFSNIQLAISTIKLPMPLPVPVIQVSAVPDKRDILLIRSFLQNRAAAVPDIQQLIQIIEKSCDVRDKAILEEQLKDYFGANVSDSGRGETLALPQLIANRILVKQRARDWDDAVRQSCQLLLEAGDILPGYVDALIEAKNRFQQYSFIGPGLCMPHAVDFDNVNRLALAFFALESPLIVDIGDGNPQSVWLITPLAMPDTESHLQLLNEINTLVNLNPNFAQEIAACDTSQQVLDRLSMQLINIL